MNFVGKHATIGFQTYIDIKQWKAVNQHDIKHD